MRTPLERRAVRLYRWLVRLYPPAFRRRFGRAMVEDFRELVEAEGAGAAGARAVRDLARSLPPAWTRVARGTSWPLAPSRLLRDLRFAVRALLRDPGFTLAAVGVLGLGIGAGTAVLGVVNAYLLRPLPYPSSDRLVDIRPALPLTLDEAREVLEIPLTWELDAFTLVGDDRPEQVLGSWVVPGFFEAYGIVPALGRTFRAEEGGEGGASVAILSHALWQRRFGGDPGVLGRTVRAYTSDRPEDAEVFTVVGLLPSDLWFHHAYTDFIAPLRALNPIYQGRLHPGLSPQRAGAALTELARGRLPDLEGGGVIAVTPLGERYVADIRPTLMLLSAAVALVLLIACGNVAVLLAVRARRRARELSVRRALGAGRAAVAVQLVVEGLVLACLAGVFGAGVASLALEALGSMVPARLGLPVPGGAAALRVDATVLAALAGVCALTGLVFGLVPLAGAGGEDLVGGMRAGRRRSGPAGSGRRSHTVVMAAELALSLALLVAAGLTVRSARHLAAVDLGIDPAGLVTAGVMLRERSYPEAVGRVDFQRRLSGAVERLPGVASVGMAVRAPLGRGYAPTPVEAEGLPAAGPDRAPRVAAQVADPGYLATLGLAPVRGRGFGPEDVLGAPPVALVSEDLARTLWPGRDPLGERLRMLAWSDTTPVWRTVVGVVPDVRQDPLGEARGDVYLPLAQEAPRFLTIVLRVRPGAASPVPALQEAVAALDPEVAVAGVGEVASLAREMTGPSRFLAFLLAAFGAFAVSLAVLGLYGTVAYAAAQSRRDLAVRMALGARRAEVTRLFVRERLGTVTAGLALGLLGGALLARLLEGQLHGVSSSDPFTYAASAAALAAVALAAVWVPARRAAASEPMRVLREE